LVLFVFYLTTALAFVVGISKVIGLSFRARRDSVSVAAGRGAGGVDAFYPRPRRLQVRADAPSSAELPSGVLLHALLLLLAWPWPCDRAKAVKLGFVIPPPVLLHYYGTFAPGSSSVPTRGSSLPDTMRDGRPVVVAVAAIV